MNKLKLSLSPHIHGGDSVRKNMFGVCIALIPALICSFIYFGLGAIAVTSVSVASCVFFEWAINKYMLKNPKSTVTDGSAILTGLLLAFNMPSNLPLWIVVIGALFAIGVVKMTFGGLGCNLFNPALAARAFLLISFPVQMTDWPVIGQDFTTIDGVSGATPLAIMKTEIKTKNADILSDLPDAWNLLIGNTSKSLFNDGPIGGGCLGEVCALAILIGLVYMLVKKIISWHIPVTILLSVFVFTGALHLIDPMYADPVSHILSGGLMLGAVFMATDYVTSPMTKKGQIIYGIAIGLLTVVIRTWGAYPEGMSFAILIMNAFTPLINNYCKPKRFGEVVK